MKRIAALAFVLCFVMFSAGSGKSKDIDRHIAVQASDKIDLRGFSSSKIHFTSWDKSEVYAKLRVVVTSSDEDYENDYIAKVDLRDVRQDGKILITFQVPGISGRGGFSWSNLLKFRFTNYKSIEITGEVYLPRSNPLFMEAKYSDVSLENMNGTLSLDGAGSTIHLKNCKSVQEIDNDYGSTAMEQCGGALSLKSAGAKVTIDRFDGPVDMNADYSTIQVRDVKGAVTINSKSSSNITAERIGGNLTIDADYSTLRFNDIRGFVTIGDQGGNIKLNGAEGLRIHALYTQIDISSVKSKELVRIETQSGKIDLLNVVADLSIEGPYTPMTISSVHGNVSISTTSTQVDLNDIAGDLIVRSEYTALRFRNVASDNVVLRDKSGDIDFESKNSPSHIEVENEYGNVTLHLPREYSAEMNLKATYGTIKCNQPLATETLGSGAFYVGKFRNGGKNKMRVRTSSGDITLKMK
jgi:DUF4097 and DUF4098 domain-containing protein YvlB